MKLNYTYRGSKSCFAVRNDSGYPADGVFEQFNNTPKFHKRMVRYQKLIERELEIVKKRKELLAKLKEDFDEFSKENFPEYLF